jgi:hypothetical protein
VTRRSRSAIDHHPASDGITEVRYGETLGDIAARYDVAVDAITGSRRTTLPRRTA